MPVVRVKGVANPMQFPDDMDINDIREFLRKRFANQAVAGNQPMDLAPLQGQARATKQSLAQKAGQGISDALVDSGIISDRFGAQQIGKNVTSIGEFLPGIGDATAGDEFGRALKQGDKFGMGIGLLSAIPLLGSLAKPAAEGASTALKSLIDASKETSPEVISSRLGRAQSQGFNVDNVVFHGTPADFKEFDPKLAGAKGDDFGEAIYFSDDPDIASGFSVSLTKNKEFQDVIDEAEKAKVEMAGIVKNNGVNSQEFKEIRSKMNQIDLRRSVLYESINEFKLPTTGSNVRPAILKGNLAKFDAKGKHYSQVNEEAVALAKSQRADGVVISNSVDAGSTKSSKPSTISIVFKPNNIRSIFDEFKAPSTDKAMSVGGDKVGEAKELLDKINTQQKDFVSANKVRFLDESTPQVEKDEIQSTLKKFSSDKMNANTKLRQATENASTGRPETKEATGLNINIAESDASNDFGEGSKRVMYTDKATGARIEILKKKGAQRDANIIELVVPEEFRGEGIAKALLNKVAKDNPSLMGQVSSKYAARNAYKIGRRPINNPDATLLEVLEAIDKNSSVNMATINKATK
jgi:GNAT superfamily N-acetyltransferase